MGNISETLYRTLIACPSERVWAELTATGVPRPWMWDSTLSGPLSEGSTYTMAYDGEDLISGTVLAVEQPVRLALTFNPQWNGTVATESPGVLEYTLEHAGEGCELTVRITGLYGASAISVDHDTPGIYAGLKAMLESFPVA
ncbi:SRPBCC domain-containing protein [Arthrobacter zhangbolii]|uniref:SRPBCC domain-containing protein n=1 Tax=Arthrobacter zhangbolii TaxID=2886936 RepID=A0A9X1M6I4_9MICC|nr:SRPBCC domain-containing protein [Arthrobacter zhangbolii]MCC3271787.1 SRPBCC domain-containing protein [Arthrobacter zhangbolii]UON93387.1 SRPBCC domain-containing protein [Arthrobacter zhangbolii]